MICLTVASALGAKKQMGGSWELSDFLPRWGGESAASEDELLARARALFDPPKKET